MDHTDDFKKKKKKQRIHTQLFLAFLAWTQHCWSRLIPTRPAFNRSTWINRALNLLIFLFFQRRAESGTSISSKSFSKLSSHEDTQVLFSFLQKMSWRYIVAISWGFESRNTRGGGSWQWDLQLKGSWGGACEVLESCGYEDAGTISKQGWEAGWGRTWEAQRRWMGHETGMPSQARGRCTWVRNRTGSYRVPSLSGCGWDRAKMLGRNSENRSLVRFFFCLQMCYWKKEDGEAHIYSGKCSPIISFFF